MNRIFVSSTFTDMHTERDLVKKIIEPELKKEAQKNFTNVEMIDLRWGVDISGLSDLEGRRHIVSTCLRCVRNCNPYMLIFLGEKYGTLYKTDYLRNCIESTDFEELQDEEYSLTALEIEVGLLKEKYGHIEDCVVCIRNPISSIIADPEDRKKYIDPQEISRQYLEKLKKKILDLDISLQNIVFYDVEWNIEKHSPEHLNVDGTPLEYVITEKFKSILKKEWDRVFLLNEFEKAQSDGLRMAQELSEKFRGRNSLINECKKVLNDNDLLILTGEEGSGKTALVASIAQNLIHEGYTVFYCWCGSSAYITNGYEIYLHVQDFIRKYENFRILLCIDGIDSFVCDDYIQYLKFLPELGPHMKAIITWKENPADPMIGFRKMIDIAALLYRKYRIVKLDELDTEDISTISGWILNRVGKDLNTGVREEILKKKNLTPLYLTFLLKRMDLADGTDLRYLSNNEALNEYFVSAVREFPDDLEEATKELVRLSLNTLEVNPKGIMEALALIASSRSGIRTDDICEILFNTNNYSKKVFQREFGMVRNYLTIIFNEDKDGIITLRHKFLYKLFDGDSIGQSKEYHQKMILRYMRKKLPDNDLLRKKDELYYALWNDEDELAMELMIKLSETHYVTQMHDLKYYGWYAHGKHLNGILDRCLKEIPLDDRRNFLRFLVDEFFSLYDGSPDELGQIQMMYNRVLRDHPGGSAYLSMGPSDYSMEYVESKAHLIIGYIVAQRGYQDRYAIENYLDVLTDNGYVAQKKRPEEIAAMMKKKILEYRSSRILEEDDVQYCRTESYYYRGLPRIEVESAIQYLLLTKQLDMETVGIILSMISDAGLNRCSQIIKDSYVALKIYVIMNSNSDRAKTLEDLKNLLDFCQGDFERTRSIRSLNSKLEVYNAIFDVINQQNMTDEIKEWTNDASNILERFQHNDFVNGKVLQDMSNHLQKKGYSSP